MAVSGSPNHHRYQHHPHPDSYLDFPCSDTPYTPIVQDTSSPESTSPSPGAGPGTGSGPEPGSRSRSGSGPVSPGGKKRVRICDSTRVRVIEERVKVKPKVRAKARAKVKDNNNHHTATSGFKTKTLRFTSGGVECRFSSGKSAEREALLGAGEYEEEEEEEEREYQEEEEEEGRECGGSVEEYRDYTEMLCTVDNLAFPDYDLHFHVLRESESLESRDNPFLPGGDLSKEAEELLKKATIVRDKFYLQQEEERKLLQEAQEQQQGRPDPIPESHPDVDAVDGTLPNAGSSPEVVEERITPGAVTQVEASAPSQPRENGKAGEEVTEDTSPDKVRVEVRGSPPAADGSAGVVSDTDAEQQDKDKAKRRPKCCLLM